MTQSFDKSSENESQETAHKKHLKFWVHND